MTQPNYGYEGLTNSMFDAIMLSLAKDEGVERILAIPGVYECVSEHLNNDVLEVYDTMRALRNGGTQFAVIEGRVYTYFDGVLQVYSGRNEWTMANKYEFKGDARTTLDNLERDTALEDIEEFIHGGELHYDGAVYTYRHGDVVLMSEHNAQEAMLTLAVEHCPRNLRDVATAFMEHMSADE